MVLVDTSILSLVLRRRRPDQLSIQERALVAHFLELSQRGDVALLGIIRQELLSGVRHREQFDRLQQVLDGYDYIDLSIADHDFAAECFNRCRSSGVAAGDVDMLICGAALRRDLSIFSTDPDFARYARVLALQLHAP